MIGSTSLLIHFSKIILGSLFSRYLVSPLVKLNHVTVENVAYIVDFDWGFVKNS